MKKRIKILTILLVICSILTTNIYAQTYNTKYYTIDIPDIYKEASAGSFIDEEGNGINIQVNSFTGEANYTQEELDSLVSALEESLTFNTEDKIAQLKEMNEQSETPLSDEELQNYATAMSYKVYSKEITTFGKEDYKCFHFIMKSLSQDNTICMEQYMTNIDNNVIAITIASTTEEGLSRQENIDAINSFALSDGTELTKKSSFSFEFVLIGLICLAICIAVIIFIIKCLKERINKKKNNKA